MLAWRSIPLWGPGSWKLVNQESGSELCKFPNRCWEWWCAETLFPIVLNSFSLRTSHGIETSKLWLMIHPGKHDFITEKHHFWIWALLVTSQDYCTSHKGHSWWMVQNLSSPHFYSALWDLVKKGKIIAWWCWLRYSGPERQIHTKVYCCWNKLYAFLCDLSYFPHCCGKTPGRWDWREEGFVAAQVLRGYGLSP